MSKVNLLQFTQLEQDDRIDAMLADYDGYDPNTGAYLRGSNGRRKPGRPRRYYAKFLNITIHITADTLEKAVSIANQKLNTEYNRIYEESAK